VITNLENIFYSVDIAIFVGRFCLYKVFIGQCAFKLFLISYHIYCVIFSGSCKCTQFPNRSKVCSNGQTIFISPSSAETQERKKHVSASRLLRGIHR